MIKTSCGNIQGIETENAQAYYSIPFGQPPVNQLRFQPAQPAQCWKGVDLIPLSLMYLQ